MTIKDFIETLVDCVNIQIIDENNPDIVQFRGNSWDCPYWCLDCKVIGTVVSQHNAEDKSWNVEFTILR